MILVTLESMIYTQVLTGIPLGLHYTPGIYTSYYSVIHIYREVYSGSLYRYTHSQIASPVYTGLLVHTSRGIFHGSHLYSMDGNSCSGGTDGYGIHGLYTSRVRVVPDGVPHSGPVYTTGR